MSHHLIDLLTSRLPCLIVDTEGIISRVSPGVAAICESALNKPVRDALGISTEVLETAVSGDAPLVFGECSGIRGKINIVQIQAARLHDGDSIFLIIIDLSPLRRAEEQRFDATPYPVLRLSKKGRVIFANTIARSFTGEIYGMPLQSFFPDSVRDILDSAFSVEAKESQTIDLPAPLSLSDASASGVRLFLMPDMGPADHVLGRIAVFSYDRLQVHRARILEAVGGGGNQWEDKLRKVLDILKEIITYDRAWFGLLADDESRFRVTLVHPQPEPPWPRRWVPVPQHTLSALKKDVYMQPDWIGAIEQIPDLRNDPTATLLRKDGVRSTLAMPVGAKGRPEAVLTLASRTAGSFNPNAASVLDNLQLEAQLGMLLQMSSREDTEAIEQIGSAITDAPSISAAVELLLRGLVEHFNWDHAALYTAEPADERMVLFRQYPIVTEGVANDLALREAYWQPLVKGRPEVSGMLGATFWGGEPLLVEDSFALDADGKRPYNFLDVGTSAPQSSAMTLPLRVNGEIRWILDVESRTTRAFAREDLKLVASFVRELGEKITLLSERLLSEELIELTEQGTLVTDRRGRILRANRRARDLLGLASGTDALGLLKEYGADPSSREVLGSRQMVERQMLRICPASGGVGNGVLATRHDLKSEVGDSVWLFTDLRVDEWAHDSRYVESTIREVARRSRGALMLASSYVNRISEGDVNPELASRAAVQLEKADLTYKQIIESLDSQKEPVRARRPLNINILLTELCKALPRHERTRIVFEERPKPLYVLGDGSRLGLALSIVLDYYIARVDAQAGENRKVQLRLRPRASMVSVSFSVAGSQNPRRTGEAKLKLGDGSIETASIIVMAHGGRIEGSGLGGECPRIDVTLPAAAGDLG